MPPPPPGSPGDRAFAALELALVVAFTLGHRAFHVLPFDETFWILALGWFSLWRRGIGWSGVGLRRPRSWANTILIGVVVGIGLQVLSEFVTEPLLARLTGEPVDLSEFKSLAGNLRLALLYLGAGWLLGAVREELAYRGYLMNRTADAFGGSGAAWLLALVFTSVLFGYGHGGQGPTAMLDSGIHALILGAVYRLTGRNLWAVILAHGVTDSIAVGMLYFGYSAG